MTQLKERKQLRLRFRVGFYGRVAWREAMVERIIKIGKATIMKLPIDIVAAAHAAGKPISIYVQPMEIYDAPDPDALRTARAAIAVLAPPSLRAIFDKAKDRMGWEEYIDYNQELVNAALQLAKPKDCGSWEGWRAPCPLCGQVPQPPGSTSGFAYPEGLTRHLEGTHNVRYCIVTQALREWSRDNS